MAKVTYTAIKKKTFFIKSKSKTGLDLVQKIFTFSLQNLAINAVDNIYTQYTNELFFCGCSTQQNGKDEK